MIASHGYPGRFGVVFNNSKKVNHSDRLHCFPPHFPSLVESDPLKNDFMLGRNSPALYREIPDFDTRFP